MGSEWLWVCTAISEERCTSIFRATQCNHPQDCHHHENLIFYTVFMSSVWNVILLQMKPYIMSFHFNPYIYGSFLMYRQAGVFGLSTAKKIENTILTQLISVAFWGLCLFNINIWKSEVLFIMLQSEVSYNTTLFWTWTVICCSTKIVTNHCNNSDGSYWCT